LPEQLPQSKHPLAAVHPRAFRALSLFRKMRRYCVDAALIALFCIFLLLMLAPSDASRRTAGPGWYGVVVLAIASATEVLLNVTVSLAVLFTLLRFVLIVLFFFRYSLGQMMVAVLSVSTCMTLIVALPGDYKALPLLFLVVLVVWGVVYIQVQDPEGESFTPAFLSRILRARKFKAIREKREAKKIPAGPEADKREA